MQTREAITAANALDHTATWDDIVIAGNRLLRCNLVTAPTIIEAWIGAWQHLERLQRDLAKFDGRPVLEALLREAQQ